MVSVCPSGEGHEPLACNVFRPAATISLSWSLFGSMVPYHRAGTLQPRRGKFRKLPKSHGRSIMFLISALLVVLALLLGWWLQADCRRILKRPFAREYFRSIVTVHRFEFLLIRNATGDFARPTELYRLTAALRCDFLGLTYLLKHTANFRQSYTGEELRLILYFQVLMVLFVTRRRLRWPEKNSLAGLTSILLYFANVIGERIERFRFENLAA